MANDVVLYTGAEIIDHDPRSRDIHIVKMWLHGRALNTQKTYTNAVKHFLAYMDKPLGEVTLPEAQAFADSLHYLSPASQATIINALRSLYRFSKDIGYIDVDVVRMLRPPKFEHKIAERILSVEEVRAIIDAAESERDRLILVLLYYGAVRLSELSSLQWRNLQQTRDGGQLTTFGKGGKTRSVVIPRQVFEEIIAMKPDGARLTDPVFRTDYLRSGSKSWNIKPRAVEYMVLAAAQRAGIDKPVSPHWLRHSHASHAIDNGAPLHVIMATLGHANLNTTQQYLHARPGSSSSTFLDLDAD